MSRAEKLPETRLSAEHSSARVSHVARGASRLFAARRTRRGITLFEAVASVAIVGAVSAAALSAVGSQYRTTARAQRALVVEALATSRLDFLDLLSNDRRFGRRCPTQWPKENFPRRSMNTSGKLQSRQ